MSEQKHHRTKCPAAGYLQWWLIITAYAYPKGLSQKFREAYSADGYQTVLTVDHVVFQEQCATSILTSVPSTPVTMGVPASTASTASPVFAQRATMMPPVCHRWMSVAATRASMVDAMISSMGERRFIWKAQTSSRKWDG